MVSPELQKERNLNESQVDLWFIWLLSSQLAHAAKPGRWLGSELNFESISNALSVCTPVMEWKKAGKVVSWGPTSLSEFLIFISSSFSYVSQSEISPERLKSRVDVAQKKSHHRRRLLNELS